MPPVYKQKAMYVILISKNRIMCVPLTAAAQSVDVKLHARLALAIEASWQVHTHCKVTTHVVTDTFILVWGYSRHGVTLIFRGNNTTNKTIKLFLILFFKISNVQFWKILVAIFPVIFIILIKPGLKGHRCPHHSV